MEFFPIVTLVIATFLLLIGIVGRGASVGSSQFHITLEGSIGRLPRVAILAVSIVTYMLAIFGFVYIAESKSSSESPPTTSVSTEAPASIMKVYVTSTLAEGYASEHDEITVGGITIPLDMDTDSSENSGYFEFDEEASGQEIDYSIKIVVTDSNGNKYEWTGKGTIIAEDGRTYVVTFDEAGTPILQ
ncbi:hypothetical protein [Streptomyces sp. NPDC096132]|uniref:hypothetical protein n=1 Tax=Streptomyces sp. NPDC096132 TaxID=3366075 RepID=UPI003818A9A6